MTGSRHPLQTRSRDRLPLLRQAKAPHRRPWADLCPSLSLPFSTTLFRFAKTTTDLLRLCFVSHRRLPPIFCTAALAKTARLGQSLARLLAKQHGRSSATRACAVLAREGRSSQRRLTAHLRCQHGPLGRHVDARTVTLGTVTLAADRSECSVVARAATLGKAQCAQVRGRYGVDRSHFCLPVRCSVLVITDIVTVPSTAQRLPDWQVSALHLPTTSALRWRFFQATAIGD